MSHTFNVWPKWAQNIERIQITCPQPWKMSAWDRNKRHDWFHANDGLKHHPWFPEGVQIEKLPWWKFVTVAFAPHNRSKQKVCHMWLENPSIGWNIWIYFRSGAAVLFEFAVSRGLPRVLKAAQ